MAAGDMSQAELVADLKASLQDSSQFFTAASDADYKRHLNAAALDFGRKRGRTLVGSLTLVADQAGYDAPASYVAFKSSLWGVAPIASPKPWEPTYPGRLPAVRLVEESGVRKLHLDPPPTAAQISALGSEYRFYYFAGHVVDTTAANTTILAAERGLLLLRGQAEAMRELMFRGIAKPVQLRDGLTSMPRNGMPSHVYEKLIEEFNAA